MKKISRHEAVILDIPTNKSGFYFCKGNKLVQIHNEEHTDILDVSDDAHIFLFRHISFTKNVCLIDIFRFTLEHFDKFEHFLSPWTKDICEDGLKSKYTDDKIDYLEISQSLRINNLKQHLYPQIKGIGALNFQGISNRNGHETSYGLTLSKPSSLSLLPLKLSPFLKFNYLDETDEICEMQEYRFIDVLHCIFEELSFYGSPSNQFNTRNDLIKYIDNEQIKQNVEQYLKNIKLKKK